MDASLSIYIHRAMQDPNQTGKTDSEPNRTIISVWFEAKIGLVRFLYEESSVFLFLVWFMKKSDG